MTVCYDVRFSHLYRALAQAGAQVLTVPAAFSPVTGAAHWHALLRARAIESGCFVIAPAQTGTHASANNKTRDTYGHSLVVDPWGEVQVDAGTEPGVYNFTLNMEQISSTRQRVPSLANARAFSGP
jgi:predicted amidohydrolase